MFTFIKNFISRIKFRLSRGKTGDARLPRVFYISGGEALPPPLKPEEEAELLSRLRGKDAARCRAQLIERNLRLVVYIARKYENTGVNVEDLISIGTIGLIKAINTFNPDKKIKLATYASRCIGNEILMHLRRNTRRKTEISIDEPLSVDWEGNELLLSDVLGTENDIISRDIENEVDKDLLRQAISKLSNREQTIIELRYGLFADGRELTQKEVADRLNISQSYISRLEKRILARLKREMSRMTNCAPA